MALFAGKQGVIMGVANNLSIAAGVAQVLHREGAKLAFSHFPDNDERGKMERRVRLVADPLGPLLVHPCDVTKDDDIKRFFSVVAEKMGKIDFIVHSIAFAPLDDIRCPTLMASREGFKQAMDISVYSLVPIARAASELMKDGGSICAMTYFGGEKVVPGYNMMGICKAALDTAVRYLAYDLGPKNIRVNAISAGPIKTLASSAVGDFKDMMRACEQIAPLRRNVTIEEVGRAAAYLLSDMSTATTGEIMHVDSGYNIMGSPGAPDA